jgi:hypothetical protein
VRTLRELFYHNEGIPTKLQVAPRQIWPRLVPRNNMRNDVLFKMFGCRPSVDEIELLNSDVMGQYSLGAQSRLNKPTGVVDTHAAEPQ